MLHVCMLVVLITLLTGSLLLGSEAAADENLLPNHHAPPLPDEWFMDLSADTAGEGDRNLQSCSRHQQHQLFYKTSTTLQIAGGNPQCKKWELRQIAEVLSKEFQTMIKIDPRLSLIFEWDNEFCDEIPEEGSANNRRLDGTTSHRDLSSYMWYSISHHYTDWSRAYEFNWGGIGECRFCPTRNARRSMLRGGNLDDDNMSNSTTTLPTSLHTQNDDAVSLRDRRSESDIDESDLVETNMTFIDHRRRELRQRQSGGGSCKVDKFMLRSCGTNPENLGELRDFSIIDWKRYHKYEGLTIEAITSENTGSLEFDWDKETGVRTENHYPWSIGSNIRADSTNGDAPKMWCYDPLKKLGTHTITAHPYSKRDRNGEEGESRTVSVLVIDSSKYDVPDNDPELINVLEDDLSFDLSYAVNKKFFRRKGFCLEEHMAYVHVDLKGVRTNKPYQC